MTLRRFREGLGKSGVSYDIKWVRYRKMMEVGLRDSRRSTLENLVENLDHKREDYSDQFRASSLTPFIHPPRLPIKQPLHSRCYIPRSTSSIPLHSPLQLPSPLA